MIQILGLRPYNRRSDGKTLLRTAFFGKGYRALSVDDILQNHAAILANVPPHEHYNLFFTVALCHDNVERGLKEQWVLPFDIDGIQIDSEDPEHIKAQAMAAFTAACEAIGVVASQTGALFSGHGVQFFVKMSKPILSGDFFDQYREHYKVLADKINLKLAERGIAGHTDTSVFSDARLMRMPGTWNRKEGKPERKSFVLNSTMETVGFDLAEQSGLGVASGEDAPTLRRYPAPDTQAVCSGCKFLLHCKDKPNEVTEPQWYAMVSITSRLSDGEALTHSYSEGHSGYSHYETEVKIKQALAASGPRTCKNIESLWSGCNTCDHYGSVLSPITIKGPDYIKSKDHGFREVVADKEGKPRLGKPAYDDLIKHFDNEYSFRIMPDTRQVYTYNGTHWVEILDLEIRAWMASIVKPSPSSQEMGELIARLLAHGANQTRLDSMHRTREGKANFLNGTVDYANGGELVPHNPEDGFTSVLPYNYDKYAQAPKFDAFLMEIFEKPCVVKVMKEFLGYCLSGDTCWLQKAVLLVGDGANGKSVLLETVADAAGRDYVSSVPMQDLHNPVSRAALVNKLFNYSEETSYNSLRDSSTFKALVTGGVTTVKKLYQQPYEIANKAKFLMSCNEIPEIHDQSRGLFRRLLIVRMEKTFVGTTDNKFLRDELRAELPGIFNMLIEAYRLAKAARSFSESSVLDNNLSVVRDESSQIMGFIDDCVDIEVTPTMRQLASKTAVYAAYKMWAINNGYKVHNNAHFFKAMRRLVPSMDERECRPTMGGEQVRAFMGIRIKDTY